MLCREAEHVDLLVDTNAPRDSELVEVDWLADSDPSDNGLDFEEQESHRKDGFVGKHYIAVLSGLAVNGSAVHQVHERNHKCSKLNAMPNMSSLGFHQVATCFSCMVTANSTLLYERICHNAPVTSC